MKNVKYIIHGIVVGLYTFALYGQTRVAVDAVRDFKRPMSMYERIHGSIVDVMHLLEQEVTADSVNDICRGIENNMTEIDAMIGLMHTRHASTEDKEFLQSMLDRIDSMIEYLESQAPDKAETIRSMIRGVQEKL